MSSRLRQSPFWEPIRGPVTMPIDNQSSYFRKQWRLSSRISCFVHRRGLRDRCPKCRSGIASFDQGELVPQHLCVRCEFDLRTAAAPKVKTAARQLESVIADIMRVETATRSAAAKGLIYRVLRAPAIAETASTKILGNLSTSTRILLFEQLASRPFDWLVPDNDASVAYRRYMILAAGGHKEWIRRSADFLEGCEKRRETRPTLSLNANHIALFEAYLRIMGDRDKGQ